MQTSHGYICRKCQSTSLQSYAREHRSPQRCDECDHSIGFDARTTNSENLLDDLPQDRQDMEGTIHPHHDPLIHLFPPEIISQIFISFVEAHAVSAISNEWNPLLLLGAVCRGWRDITLNIPELWAKVTIHIPQEASSRWAEVAGAWFSRSGAVPMSLTIKNMDPSKIWDASRISRSDGVFQLIRGHSSRWQNVTLECPFTIANALLTGLDVSHIDLLRLTIKDLFRDDEPVQIPVEVPFNPRSLYVASFSLLDKFPMRWDRLTSLEAHKIGANELLHILRHGINLQTLTIGNTSRPKRLAGDPYPDPLTPFTLNSLTSLDVSPAYIKSNILQHLTLPSLKFLKYSFKGPAANNDLDDLVELLDGSAPRFLEDFTFVCGTSQDERNYQCYPDEDTYDRIPSVTHLVVAIHSVQDSSRSITMEEFLRPFGTNRQSVLLPHLREVEVIAPTLSTTSWSYLCNLSGPVRVEEKLTSGIQGSALPESRTGRPIERVSVSLQAHWKLSQDEVFMDEATFFCLRKIRESGVDVKVVCNDGTVDVLNAYGDIYAGEE